MVDSIRTLLDQLMGKDRNRSLKELERGRDNYWAKDVCKPFLISFCFNQLFPNTNYDEGECPKRHDHHLKKMFLADKYRNERELEYIDDCIAYIEKRLLDVDSKIKKNRGSAENKVTVAERPREILDHLAAIDLEIEKLEADVSRYGMQGKIKQSERAAEEIEKLEQKKKDVEASAQDFSAANRQVKICEICGAIQTINDTEKRLVMHVQGKIHQGFLRFRSELSSLRQRRQKLMQLIRIDRERAKDKDKDREKEKDLALDLEHREAELREKREQQRRRDREKDKQKDREKQKEKEKEKEKKEEKEKEKEKKERQRSREKDNYVRRDQYRLDPGRRRRRDSSESSSRSRRRKDRKRRRSHDSR